VQKEAANAGQNNAPQCPTYLMLKRRQFYIKFYFNIIGILAFLSSNTSKFGILKMRPMNEANPLNVSAPIQKMGHLNYVNLETINFI
jgi:hypothetical protein